MRFNKYKGPIDEDSWIRWFAWYPVVVSKWVIRRLGDTHKYEYKELVWLEYVYRKNSYWYGYTYTEEGEEVQDG